MTQESRIARAFAYAHSYRKHMDRAPLVNPRPPIRYKRLVETLSIALPPADETLLAQQTIPEIVEASAIPRKSSFLTLLSTLLYFNLGIVHINLSNGIQTPFLHRCIPSPGSLCPSELYTYVPENNDIPEGLYHYHSLHHDLTLLHDKGSREYLEHILERDLGKPELVLIVGSNLWRVIHKYADFGYRLATLEAGHLIGNILLVGAALGLQGRVHYFFNDDLLEEYLGVPGLDDAGMAIIPLYRSSSAPSSPITSLPDSERGEREAAKGHWHLSSGMHTSQAARVRELELALRASRHQPTPARESDYEVSEDTPVYRRNQQIDLQAPPSSTCSLLTAYQQRSSAPYGPFGLAVSPIPILQSSLAFVLQHSFYPYAHDLSQENQSPAYVRLVLMTNHVQGVSPGGYTFDATTGNLSRLVDKPYPATAFAYEETVNNQALGCVWALIANYDTAFHQLGARAYRIVNIEAGIVAQRICMLAAAEHLFARPFCAYKEQILDSWLGLHSSAEQTIYTVLSGYNHIPAFRFQLPINA